MLKRFSTKALSKNLLVSMKNVSKRFNGQVEAVLDNVSLDITRSYKVTLVGDNGVGKSTLIKLIMGDLQPDDGAVIKSNYLRVGHLPQDHGLLCESIRSKSLLEVATLGTPLEESAAELLAEYAGAAEGGGSSLEEARRFFNACGGYKFYKHIQGFGLDYLSLDHPFRCLSGGERSKVLLTRLFLDEYDLLLLDEPTNHIDLKAITWLEQYLQRCKESIVLITHDRTLLDTVSTHIFEIDGVSRQLMKFKGKYRSYLEQKKAQYESQLQTYHRQEKQEKVLIQQSSTIHQNSQSYIPTMKDSFKLGFNARGARKQKSVSGKIKQKKRQLERLQEHRISYPLKSPKVDWTMPDYAVNSDIAILINDISVVRGERVIFENVSFSISAGERILVTGSNGVGKSSLLAAIANEFVLVNGTIEHDELNVAYMPQDNSIFDQKLSVYETFKKHTGMQDDKKLFELIYKFTGLPSTRYDHPLENLSMGQITRIKFAIAMLRKPDVLLLDEPTNHLDPHSAEHLEENILNFPGAIVVVSHDRWFINKLMPDSIYQLKDRKLQSCGNTHAAEGAVSPQSVF